MKINQIIEQIIERQDEILSNLNFEFVAVYVFLNDEYSKGDILNNFVFQYVFKSWWGIARAGWSDEMKKRFFELLSEKQLDLKTILSELYEIPTLRGANTIQFAFATKLLHTIDNDNPIFDKMVGKIIGMEVMKAGKGDENERINSCIEIQNYLKELYNRLKTDEKIKQVILKFRLKFKKVHSEKITDIKILDFIIWSLGQLEL